MFSNDKNIENKIFLFADMFVGQLKSTLRCTQCDYRSPTFELFWHLAVPIPKQVINYQTDDIFNNLF